MPIDMFSPHPLNGMPFSTRDRENDIHSKLHCAVNYVGNADGWWYAACSYILLNHEYKNRHGLYIGHSWKALSFTEMKIRPINCKI